MDQSEADWGDWSLNNAAEMDPLLEDMKSDDIIDICEVGNMESNQNGDQVLPGEEGLTTDYGTFEYDEGLELSGSDESEMSDMEPDESDLQHKVDTEASPQTLQTNIVTAKCDFCGYVGARDAFYAKAKKFCSVSCSRNFCTAIREGKNIPVRSGVNAVPPPTKTSKNQVRKSSSSTGLKTVVPSFNKQGSPRSFDWGEYLRKTMASGAPVSCFKHCPLADNWSNITVGMKVEVINLDCDLPTKVYWIATVLKLAGYKSLMRYEGFGSENFKDFWINVCSRDVHPVGWCAANKKSLVPPNSIQQKYSDWKDFLIKRLTGARTLPQNFRSKLSQSLQSNPLKPNTVLEVVDKMCVSAMKVAAVQQAVGGRLRLKYVDSKIENDDFWCHNRSSLVHPIGWAQLVGHKLHSSPDYKTESLNKAALKKYSPNDATPDMFPKPPPMPSNGLRFQAGMKLEAIDPLNLSCICVGTVMKVLRSGYLMIGIDGSMAADGSDWFCFHATSPCIFPVGFCEINNIELTPPRGYKGVFKWFDYMKETRAVAAAVKLFDKEIPKHGFKQGMKLEAVDLMEPRLICVATIVRVVGRLLRVHFDGWEASYDQWVDCQSPDIYPVSWCELVNYHLEGPRMKVRRSTLVVRIVYRRQIPTTKVVPRAARVKIELEVVGRGSATQLQMEVPQVASTAAAAAALAKKRKSKSQMYRGPRKKRKPKMLTSQVIGPGGRPRFMPTSSIDSSDLSQDSPGTDSPQLPLFMSGHIEEGLEAMTESSAQQQYQPRPGDATSTVKQESSESDGCNILAGTEISEPAAQPLAEWGAGGASDVPKMTDVSAAASSRRDVISTLPRITTVLHSPPKAGTAAGMVLTVAPTALPASGHLDEPTQLALASPPHIGAPGAITTPTYTLYPLQSGRVQMQESSGESPARGIGQVVTHNIPRVIPGEPDKDCAGPMTVGKDTPVSPHLWSVFDVCQFLRINDCGAYCDSFRKKDIDGPTFMLLTKEQIVNLTGMKVGPSLKIYDMIQALKLQVVQQQQDQPTTSRILTGSAATVSSSSSPAASQVAATISATVSGPVQTVMTTKPMSVLAAHSPTLKSHLTQSLT